MKMNICANCGHINYKLMKTDIDIIMLLEVKHNITISDIKRHFNMSYKYIFYKIKLLHRLGIIDLDKRKNIIGQPVYVKLKNGKANNIQ